jgi:Uma2 family endonuclease
LATAPKQRLYTFDDFCHRVNEDQKADLIDGVIYMASPENNDANRLFVWLITLVSVFVSERDLGDVFGSRSAFRLDDGNSPEPDIAFVRKARLHLVMWGYTAGSPDLAREIVSPESVERDYSKKRAQFEAFGVIEYWIIDELKKKITLLRLDRKGKYRVIRPKHGRYDSKVLPGFWLESEWLWQSPRPKPLAILTQMLANDTE